MAEHGADACAVLDVSRASPPSVFAEGAHGSPCALAWLSSGAVGKLILVDRVRSSSSTFAHLTAWPTLLGSTVFLDVCRLASSLVRVVVVHVVLLT